MGVPALGEGLSHVKTKTYCEFYNQSMCTNSRKNELNDGCYEKKECEPVDSADKRSHCFVVWSEDGKGNASITLKGCFQDNEECNDKSECIGKVTKSGYLYCCCERDMCNTNFSWIPPPITEKNPVKAPEPHPETVPVLIPLLICLSVVSFLIILAIILLWLYHKNKHVFNELPTMEIRPLPSPSPFMDLRPIQLIEIKARGRFGSVWKARYKTVEVAVKIFPVQDKQSWLAEQEIYKLPFMNHPNILHFIGVEKRGESLLQSEFWLITEYHELGSLCDFLKAHTLTWAELCRIVESMSRGLTHLHEDIHDPKPGDMGKPAIAHRDFKSKNVLLKNDLTACIADFGLAMIFYSGKSCGDTHGQVGTRRYMAPEVLEGAISFTQDAFLRIDMYACGLVLWELASRCTAQDGPVPEYHLPFEEEVGQHPTLEEMQEYVVQRKVRPNIPETWRNHSGLVTICDTMEECWDHDAEARLSASCIMERVMFHSRYQFTPVGWNIDSDKPLKENSF